MTNCNWNACILSLGFESLDNASNGRFEEICNILSFNNNVLNVSGSEDDDNTYPFNLSWPERISYWGSLSRMVPNLIYDDSSGLRNLSLVLLSKM